MEQGQLNWVAAPPSATLPAEVTRKRLSPASTLCVAHTCVWLAFGVSAVSLAAQPTSRPSRQSTTAITGGQSHDQRSMGASVRYPTMLDMTFPEFEAAAKKTDIVLLPIGAIEEHSSHLPLGTDAMNATAQVFHVQQYLRTAGVDTIVGPPLNIGITNEAGDWALSSRSFRRRTAGSTASPYMRRSTAKCWSA